MSSVSLYRQLLNQIGQAGVNALFPNDFEYYVLTFELVDSRDNLVEYLTLPVNPDNFSENQTELTSITKTAGGISAFSSEKFVPKNISISGTFGRKFNLLLGAIGASTVVNQVNSIFGRGKGGGTGAVTSNKEFSINLKTGYGTLKKLEGLLKNSNQLDSFSQPHKLYMYNLMNNNNYLVELVNFEMMQEYSSSNRVWRYNISLQAVAPVDQVQDDARSLFEISSRQAIQKSSQQLLSSIKRLI